MNTQEFIEKLKEETSFIVYDNNDSSFSHLSDDEVALAGKDETEVFALKIVKVK